MTERVKHTISHEEVIATKAQVSLILDRFAMYSKFAIIRQHLQASRVVGLTEKSLFRLQNNIHCALDDITCNLPLLNASSQCTRVVRIHLDVEAQLERGLNCETYRVLFSPFLTFLRGNNREEMENCIDCIPSIRLHERSSNSFAAIRASSRR